MRREGERNEKKTEKKKTKIERLATPVSAGSVSGQRACCRIMQQCSIRIILSACHVVHIV